jgi:Cell division protein CrgA
MAPPKRKAGGRVTPKGTRPGQLPTAAASPGSSSPSTAEGVRHAATASSRYTPPVAKSLQESPRWVPILMFSLLILGGLVIFFNYLGILLPGATNNWYLLVGLAFILGGIVTATQYR